MKQFVRLAILSLLLCPFYIRAQGTAFTYQGRLNSGGNSANGNYDLTFNLFAANTGGSPLVDEGGVALAAIQGSNQKLNEKDAEIQELKARLEKLEQLMNSWAEQTK